MCENQMKYFCPRLLDYIIIVGTRNPNHNNNVAQTPELLRRYPVEDHADFPLPTDVIFFCQPEGCISEGPKRTSLRETTPFVFSLTEKDSGKVRYGICVNFFRPFERKCHSLEKTRNERYESSSFSSADSNLLSASVEIEPQKSPRTKRRLKTASRMRNNTLTSLCIISHHPFFSTFRECLFLLRKLIDACHDRSCTRRIGGSKGSSRDTVWGVLTGQSTDCIPNLVLHEIRELETWILRLLSAPVPVPGKTRVEVQVLSKDLQPPLLFALPDHTRFSLIDFPLHLPLELLGVETCLKVLTCILLEQKLVLQSRDYNALSMSVMAFVSMLYPLEYMFPVIPLLPTCMTSAEQLLLAPTPYIIGVPASFFLYKQGFRPPDDVWLIDLDSNKIYNPVGIPELPQLPEPEGAVLKNHLKQALASMSMTPQPIKNLDALAQSPELLNRRESFSSNTGFNPLIYGNDVDSVDVATRVAMVRFFNSPNILGNFTEHTRTLRLYPRPVVAFQLHSFFKSRPTKTSFTAKLAKTQAVEYFAEWSLCPQNVVFLRVQTAVYDPSLIGDKPKWYVQALQPVDFRVYDDSSSLGAAIMSVLAAHSDDNPTDESGSDSDGADSTSSSYSSLSDFVTDMVNSEIDGDTPVFIPENQILAVDHSKVFTPPSKLHVPEPPATNSDSAFSMPESDLSSSESSSPSYSQGAGGRADDERDSMPEIFQYDSGTASMHSRPSNSSYSGDLPGTGSLQEMPQRMHSSSKAEKSSMPANDKTPTTVPVSEHPLLLEGSATARVPHQHHMGQRQGSLASIGPAMRQKIKSTDADKTPTPASIISTISSELNDIALSTSSTISGLFDGNIQKGTHRNPPAVGTVNRSTKPFAPLGNRKALVEKSGLVKHGTSRRPRELHRQQSVDPRNSNSENQMFLKEVINSVLDGQGVSWLKTNRLKKLMEDENYRNFVVSRLNKNLDKKLNDDSQHIEDVCISRQVFKGMLTVVKAMVHGLEYTYRNRGLGGMASAFMILEIAHTHFWMKELGTSNKTEASVTPEVTVRCGVAITAIRCNIASTVSCCPVVTADIRGSGISAVIHSQISSPYGSRESLSSKGEDSPPKPEARSLHEEHMVAALGPHILGFSPHSAAGHTYTGWWPERASPSQMYSDRSSSSTSTESGSPVIINGEEFENIEMPASEAGRDEELPEVGNSGQDVQSSKWKASNLEKSQSVDQTNVQIYSRVQPCNIVIMGSDTEKLPADGTDMLRELVRNKELLKARKREKINSIDSEVSDGSTLVSSGSENPPEDDRRQKPRINHHAIRNTMSDSEMEMSGMVNYNKRSRSSSIWNTKSNLSAGFRYHDGKMINTSPLPSPETGKTYLFEGLIGKERTRLWDYMQFWEDMFLDAVAQERDIIGMDQGPSEMMERYNSLGNVEKKRLEHDEDKLLSVMLYNLSAFMVMIEVKKVELKKKIRRLLGKSHIGLIHSQEVNDLMDQINNLYGNDIDLKPMGSRMMQKQSFTVHWGSDNIGDMLFMEVCDDCIILRSVTGAICDRWWYEKLVNMTYCPKTKVFCLWRKIGERVQLNQFYTKKCRELYLCVKETMGKAAARNNGKVPGHDLGGEFPVQDLKSGQGGLLQVCMEGIGLLLANSKFFIELSRVKKCFTQKGGIFVLEEFDPQTQQVIPHKFKSGMADQICYAVLCLFSYVAAGLEYRRLNKSHSIEALIRDPVVLDDAEAHLS